MVVVEGYFDAIAMHQAGIGNTVATSGTALTSDHARVLKRMTRGVALTYDGDAAGQQAMLRSLGVLLAAGLDVVVVDLPAGEDPDTLVRRAGAEGWASVRAAAYDAVEFIQRHVLRNSTGGDPRERALNVVVRLLAGITDAIRHRLLVERASQVFGLSEAVIARAARQVTRGDERGLEPVAAAVRAQREAASRRERDFLLGLWYARHLLDEVRETVLPAHLSEGSARALYQDWLEHGVALPAEESGAAALARELVASGSEGLNHEELVRGGAIALRRHWLEQRLRTISRLTGQTQDPDALLKLQRENFEIAQALKELRV
jgi:DNA primase